MLNIFENQLLTGQVKRITSNGGTKLDYVEMLVGEKTKAQLYFDSEKNVIQLAISDTDLDLPDLACSMNKETLRNLIVSLKDLYNMIQD